MDRIILASKSPRRKQLLEWAEIPYEVMVSDADESYPPDMDWKEIPIYVARKKAEAIRMRTSEVQMIVAADTLVVLNGEVIGKPMDRADAIAILSRLSGQKHTVITGVVMTKGNKELAFADITEVLFHTLTYEQIHFYVDKYQPYDKAGAYAIQEWIGVVGIKAIHGDFYNVMGFPVSRLVNELRVWKD
jgi:septum formation protein